MQRKTENVKRKKDSEMQRNTQSMLKQKDFTKRWKINSRMSKFDIHWEIWNGDYDNTNREISIWFMIQFNCSVSQSN